MLGKWSFVVAFAGLCLTGVAQGQAKYDPGASDTTIRVGNIVPYSGPASAYGIIGKGLEAYFKMINDAGGINGRKLELISLDDGYNPTKTLALTRRLVEQDKVLLMLGVLGTPTNSATREYHKQRKVPQLFVGTGATKFNDPVNYPYTIGWQPTYQAEERVFVRHLLKTNPAAKIAILYQNDDYGKDHLEGLKKALGERAQSMIVAEASYEVTDPTIATQIVALKESGADTFFNIATPKFAAQAIKKIAEIGWKPTHYLNSVANYVQSVMIPAGPENGIGILTAFYLRDPGDPQWHDTKEYKDWAAWMKKYYPDGELNNNLNVWTYTFAQLFVQVIKQAGDNLTRENIMKQAANLDMDLPMLLPGIRAKTSPSDYAVVEDDRMARWDGKQWVLLGGDD